jgi:lambda family phage tail tape measure protein
MADTIAAGVIEFTGDASGVSSAVAQAVGAVKQFEQAVGQGMTQSAQQATVATDKLDSSTKRYVTSIEKEIQSINLSRSEYRAWEAQLKGIGEGVYGPLVTRLKQARDAQDAAAKASLDAAAADREAARVKKETAAADARAAASKAAYIAQLREEIALSGRSANEREIYKASRAGGPEAVQQVVQLQNMRAAQDAVAQSAREMAQAQREAATRKAGNDAFVSSLQSQANAIGKTKSQLLELEAAQRGVSAQAAPYIAALRAQETALTGNIKQLNAYGISAKQQAAALRGVPAQITDIVVGLQGGQAPLTVLLQQGGQLKDMFGGIVPAFRALGGAVIALVTPFTLLATTIAAVTFGYAKGAAEQDAYVKALATTGNRAGVTAGQLGELARQLDNVVGTQAAAAGALSTLVDTGQVSGIQDLARFAETAIRAQRLLGVSVADTAKAYAELGKDPVSASKRLTEQMNYLTQAQFEQINALVEANREADAAVVAQRAYDEALRRSASEVENNLGLVQRGWRAAKDAAAEAWDQFLGAGRAPTVVEQLGDIQERLNRARRFESFIGVNTKASSAIEDERNALNRSLVRNMDNAMALAATVEANRKAIDATSNVQKLQESAKGVNSLARELKRYRDNLDAIRAVNPNSALLSPAAIKAGEDAIRRANRGPAAPRPKAFQDDEATKYLIRLRETEAALKEQLQSENKLTEAQRERARFESLVADLRTKGTLTADQKSILSQETAIRKQLDINVGIAESIRLKKEAADADALALRNLEAYKDSIERINVSIASANEARSESITRALSGFGSGDQKREELEAQRQINREFQKYRDAVVKAAITNDQPVDFVQIDKIKAAQSVALAEVAAYYQQLKTLQMDWSNGATRALENYYNDSQKVADQISDAFTSAFSGLEDALTTFASTGKLSFSDLANSIVADINRIIIKAQITGPLSQALQGQMSSGSGFGGYLSGLFGNIFGGGGGFGSGLAASYAKANGGYAPAHSIQRVVENGPELLTIGNKTALITGSQGGQVTPLRGGGNGGGRNVTFVLNPPAGMDRRASRQFLADAAVQLRTADGMNN